LTTFGQLLDTFWTTFGQLLDNFWTTFGQLLDNFWTTFLTTFWQLLTTFWQLFLFFDGGSQLQQQILWNKFNIHCAYFTPNCTWSLNYSVLVYTKKRWKKVNTDCKKLETMKKIYKNWIVQRPGAIRSEEGTAYIKFVPKYLLPQLATSDKHNQNEKKVKKLSKVVKRCQKSVKKLFKSCQKMSKRFQKVVKKLSNVSKKLLKISSHLIKKPKKVNCPENKNGNGKKNIIGIP
jgi:hypothetical protein